MDKQTLKEEVKLIKQVTAGLITFLILMFALLVALAILLMHLPLEVKIVTVLGEIVTIAFLWSIVRKMWIRSWNQIEDNLK